jgi:hypothetical protein
LKQRLLQNARVIGKKLQNSANKLQSNYKAKQGNRVNSITANVFYAESVLPVNVYEGGENQLQDFLFMSGRKEIARKKLDVLAWKIISGETCRRSW